MNTNKKKLSYKDAVAEIEVILEQIETGELDVDELSEKVKRVSSLVALCREKLHSTEEEIEKILNEMDNN
jgi:exodeoxyribonuclease VII small subunit